MYHSPNEGKVAKMANSKQMAQAIAQVFDVQQVSAEIISRTLMETGLRTNGGRGRGAFQMTGRDFLNVSIALASGLGMREAPAFVESVVHLPLTGGSLFRDGNPIWEAPTLRDGAIPLVARLQPKPITGMEVFATLGPAVAGWIDGMMEGLFAWSGTSSIKLEISNIGPTADFEFKSGDDHLVLTYAPEGYDGSTPAWERRTIIRDPVLRQFAALIRGGRT